MPAMTSLLAASAAIGGAASLYGAVKESDAIKAKAEFDKQQAGHNAALADLAADDAISRGSKEANRAMRQGRQVQSEQRVALAAQGIDINSGSAAELLDETDAAIQEDYETIRNNAWREAWGFKTEAANTRGSAKFGYAAAQNQARNTLIMGGLNAASDFARAGANVSDRVSEGKAADAAKQRALVERNKRSARDYWGNK